MKVKNWLSRATQQLESEKIASSRIDALILLEDTTNQDRSWLLAHQDFELNQTQQSELANKLARRTRHEPLAYIRGKAEFYGHEFIVTSATLQPPPETETMLELLWSQKVIFDTIVDIGTGSGAIAISAKLKNPNLLAYATEINKDALHVAHQNIKRLKADVIALQGNLLEPVMNIVTANAVLLCNLPYVPNDHTINKAAMQEPKVAIFGGKDGLDLYRELFQQIKTLKIKPISVFTESLPFQHQELLAIASEHGYVLQESQDLIQVFTRSTQA